VNRKADFFLQNESIRIDSQLILGSRLVIQVVCALLRGNWQDFNWHGASRGPSAIAELLVLSSDTWAGMCQQWYGQCLLYMHSVRVCTTCHCSLSSHYTAWNCTKYKSRTAIILRKYFPVRILFVKRILAHSYSVIYAQQVYSTNKTISFSVTMKQHCDVKYCRTKLLGVIFQLHSSSVESQR